MRLGNEFNNFVPLEGHHVEGEEEHKKEVKGPYKMEAKRVIFSDFMAGREGENRPYCEV